MKELIKTRNIKAQLVPQKKVNSKKELALKNPPMNRPKKNKHAE